MAQSGNIIAPHGVRRPDMARASTLLSSALMTAGCSSPLWRAVLRRRRSTVQAPGHKAAGASPLAAEIDRLAAAVEPELLYWRRYLHQHPELSNRESETAKYVADRLKSFGLEPKTGVARTGVVAVLKGGRPGPGVALRADMDGLPVREEVDVPFASKATAQVRGQDVGVMHACGHDTHMAILLATATRPDAACRIGCREPSSSSFSLRKKARPRPSALRARS